MKQRDAILYVDLDSGEVEVENVYGGFWIRLLYGTGLGRLVSGAVAAPAVSRIYGRLQDRPSSRRKIRPFVERFGIAMDDFLVEEGRPPHDPYSSFNAFFTRRARPDARPVAEPPALPAPCDARYFGYAALDESVRVPVKGRFLAAPALLRNEAWSESFVGGPGFVARLCPVDYHRFHFPDDGEVLDSWRLPGALHSVNPWALAARADIFLRNERQVSILATANLGKLAFVEVGATFVGSIVQTHTGPRFSRGDEKGMFRFGGSSVVVLGEPGRWSVSPKVLENTANGLETYLKMGRALGRAI